VDCLPNFLVSGHLRAELSSTTTQTSCLKNVGDLSDSILQGQFNHTVGDNRGHSTILRDATGAIQSSYRRKQGPYHLQEATGAIHLTSRRQQGPFNHPAGGNWGHTTILQESTGDIQPTRGNRVPSTILQETTESIQLSYRRQQEPFNHPVGCNRYHSNILQESTAGNRCH
jgi:hypothetical protein